MLAASKHCLVALLVLLSVIVQGQSIYKTPSGKKYHLGSCRMVENTSQKISPQQAIELGLGPCSFCKPDIRRLIPSTENKSKGQSVSVQCKGTTKAGTRCKHHNGLPMAIATSTNRNNKHKPVSSSPMSDPIFITVPYKNTEQQFEIQLEARGYIHRFVVLINDIPVYFEPDEEKKYRAIIPENHAHTAKSLDPVLLQSIAATLEKELS